MEIHFSDHLEKEVAEALDKRGIKFIHESQGAVLDFYLPDYDVSIEVKQFHTERVNRQLEVSDNIILLQGAKSVKLFCKMMIDVLNPERSVARKDS